MNSPVNDAGTRTVGVQTTPRQRSAESGTSLTDIGLTATIVAGLLDAVPDGLLMIDGSGVLVLVNSRIEEMFGYTRGELLGQPVEMLLPEGKRETHTAHRENYSANPRIRPMGAGCPLRGRRKDGSDFPVDISLSPLTADGRWTVAAVRDDRIRQAAENGRRDIAVSAEQARIAEALADTVIHDLFGTGLQLHGALNRPGEIRAGVEAAIDSIDHTIRDVRGTIFGLRNHQSTNDAPGPAAAEFTDPEAS
jgi:PAS domain S-box-containing protein